jgi:SAM-dependent methyltransferase
MHDHRHDYRLEKPVMKTRSGYHETRFVYDQRRDLLWKTLCEAYFQKLIPRDACVLELGAGYGHFINHIRCARRIAADKWEGMPRFIDSDVKTYVGSVTDLSFVKDRSVDYVFASNLFEHLTQKEFTEVLEQVSTKLKAGGTLNILQPNYRFAYREYFDDYSHISIYSDRSMKDFLSCNGFKVIDCKPRFLPLTVKSLLPVLPFLIRLYILLPFKPMGKQMLIRAMVEE